MGIKNKVLSSNDELFINIIEKEIRPFVKSHGGDISFVSYDCNTQIVTVKLSGACVGCPIAFYTLKAGVLQTLKKTFPTLHDVVSL